VSRPNLYEGLSGQRLPRVACYCKVADEELLPLISQRSTNGYRRVSAREFCRKHAISDAAFYTWRKKFGCMHVPEVKRLKSLKEENAPLGKLLAETILDEEALQVAPGRMR